MVLPAADSGSRLLPSERNCQSVCYVTLTKSSNWFGAMSVAQCSTDRYLMLCISLVEDYMYVVCPPIYAGLIMFATSNII